MWLIVEYAKENTECHQLWTQLQDVTMTQKKNKASEMKERRKEMQRKAMLAMTQQQSAFALSIDDDMNVEEVDPALLAVKLDPEDAQSRAIVQCWIKETVPQHQ